MKGKFLYSAYVLTENSKRELSDWILYNEKPMMNRRYLHHCTIEFRDNVVVKQDMDGDYCKIKIIGYTGDENATAFLVSNDTLSTNMYPHITITTAEGILPVYCNRMIEINYDNTEMFDDNVELFDKPIIIEVYIKRFYLPFKE